MSFTLPITLTLVGYTASVLGIMMCRRLGMLPRSADVDKNGHPLSSVARREKAREQRVLLPLVVTTALAPVSNGKRRPAPKNHGNHLDLRRHPCAPSNPATNQPPPSNRLRCRHCHRPSCSRSPPSPLRPFAQVLANYSLLLNSVGVYQLSKVLVTPAIVGFERSRGGKPLSTERIACLFVVSLGVCVVTVSDVTVNVYGLAVATVNIGVAGYYKVEWAHVCRVRKYKSLELMSLVMPKATVS